MRTLFGIALAIAASLARADAPLGTIAFASQTPREFDLFATDVTTGTTRRLTEHGALDFNVAMSPDGKREPFAELVRDPVRRPGLVRLTHNASSDGTPEGAPTFTKPK